MRPAKRDIFVQAGDDWRFPIKIRNAITGDFYYFDGWTGNAQIRATRDSETVIASMTVTVDDYEIVLSLDEVQSRAVWTALQSGTGVWDLELIEPDGSLRTWLEGSVTTQLDVTRVE